jgi:hypothetical protein
MIFYFLQNEVLPLLFKITKKNFKKFNCDQISVQSPTSGISLYSHVSKVSQLKLFSTFLTRKKFIAPHMEFN